MLSCGVGSKYWEIKIFLRFEMKLKSKLKLF